MPYLKITFIAPDPVWVRITDGDAACPDEYGDICDTVISDDGFAEAEFGEPVDELPADVQLRADLT